MKNHEFSYPVYVITNGVYKTGHLKDIGPSQIGIFDYINRSTVSNPAKRQEIFLAAGSTRSKDQIGDIAGLKRPIVSQKFLSKDILSFEVSLPQKETRSNKVSVGFSGGSCSEGIKFKCNTNYVIKVVLKGSPILRYFGKPLEKVIGYNTGCCPDADCVNCPDESVDCEKHTKAIVELLNTEVELEQAGLKARYVSNLYTAPTPNKTKYCLEVCDDGDILSLQTVQAAVGNKGLVSRTSRKDCKSQYTYCGDVIAPDFVPSTSVKLAVCGTCDSGYTLSPAADVYNVVRPLSGTEDLTTDATKQAYADSIATAYSGTNATFISQNGATATVSFTVPVGTVVTALLADSIVKTLGKEATCVPVAPTPIAWVSCGTAYKEKRKLKITLQRQDCSGADRLAELTEAYATHPEVVIGSIVKIAGSVGCEDCYEMEQWSIGCMSDECLATDMAVYNEIGSFDGVIWEVVKTEPTADPNKKCGFTVEANIPEEIFSNCSFDLNDFYEDEPVTLEIGWELEFPDTCSLDDIPQIKTIKDPIFRKNSGEFLIRELYKSNIYTDDTAGFKSNPRLREVLGQNELSVVKRNSFYKIYYLRMEESREKINTFSEQPRFFEPIIAFEETDPKAADFEKTIASILSESGVVLKSRSEVRY